MKKFALDRGGSVIGKRGRGGKRDRGPCQVNKSEGARSAGIFGYALMKEEKKGAVGRLNKRTSTEGGESGRASPVVRSR